MPYGRNGYSAGCWDPEDLIVSVICLQHQLRILCSARALGDGRWLWPALLLQLRVLGLGFLQDRDVGVGVFREVHQLAFTVTSIKSWRYAAPRRSSQLESMHNESREPDCVTE
jgi:hypothetical protein